MKPRFHLRILWPFILILVASLAALALLFPLVQGSVFQQAAEPGGQVNYVPLFTLVFLILAIGLMFGLLINIYYTNQHLNVLEDLTDAAKELGEGRFTEIEIPEDVGELPEIQELAEALQKTALQTEEQFNALTKEQAMLSAVLDHMTDGVLIADDSGKVQLLNTAAEKLFKIENDQAIDRSVVEVMRHYSLVDLWEKTKNGNPETIDMELGSAHKYLQVVGISLEKDLPGRTMLLFQDLTQTHQLEIVRRDFVSNISHELRTPIAGLKAISETLLDGALDDPPAARKFLVHMDNEVDNLIQIVNELLELSRIEAGRSNFEFQRNDPCRLINNAYERMILQAEKAGVRLTQECPPGLPQVSADPVRISQVFINLIHNAIKFTHTGGHIHLTAWRDDNKVVFMVQDDGVGVAKKDLKRIFERFYKADRARSGGGTGLGLSICKHIVDAHGGQIWVESEENAGSKFFFTIPATAGGNIA
ncbi:MAG TPA: PAS domain-containing sensor histidine kinase [Anaerolineaceae bacterium]|jgi:two-component system phosphate regulon sensor histidine kinase PhoR|nr:PAS domain-containing sensor histidine kinase [Anaerolineaceae bacterium]